MKLSETTKAQLNDAKDAAIQGATIGLFFGVVIVTAKFVGKLAD